MGSAALFKTGKLLKSTCGQVGSTSTGRYEIKGYILTLQGDDGVCHLVDSGLDLSPFHARYKNDVEGTSAFDPAVLIKIILLAYSRSIIHSRKIEAACRENVLFVAVSGDSQPHFTTLAAFVSGMGDLVAKLFAQVLFICDRQGLIGREMFAIDGVKLPANASKAKSGNLKALAA